jgi:uncharacterized protein (DUF1800 family)
MPLTPLSGQLGIQRAAHLLRRATFGPTKSDIDTFKDKTAAEAIVALFADAASLPIPDAPIDTKTGLPWVELTPSEANSNEGDLQNFFKGWFIAQMIGNGLDSSIILRYSAREKIVFFIHTILTAITSKIDSSRALYFQNQLFREFALDKDSDEKITFKELTKHVSTSNAMLRLLDGNLNVIGSPNENYARELLELYTIGRGLEGHVPETTEQGDYYVYKEQDVQAAAKVLSGWDFDPDFTADLITGRRGAGKVRGGDDNAGSHDNTAKTFSDRFDGTIIQRPTDQVEFPGTNATKATALDEVSQLIDMIYSKRETAMNICRRIYRFFVYHDITEDIDTNVISPLADTFIASDFKLQPVLEELFASQHFYEAGGSVTDDNFGSIIRSPLDLMLGTYRMFDITLPDYKTAPIDLYARTGEMLSQLSNMGLNFYEPYDVAGYDAYHQYPIFHRAWISTNWLTQRYQFIKELITPMVMTEGAPRIDSFQFVFNQIAFSRAAVADQLIEDLTKYFLPRPEKDTELTEARLNYFKKVFLEQFQIDADPEGRWTTRWNEQSEIEATIGQLNSLFNSLLQSPEYQLY